MPRSCDKVECFWDRYFNTLISGYLGLVLQRSRLKILSGMDPLRGLKAIDDLAEATYCNVKLLDP